MLKKSITYEKPFADQKVTEEFYFHISKADLVRMEVEEHKERFEESGKEYTGFEAKLHRIVAAEDGRQMMPLFEDIIRRSYGRKDGDRFMRSEEIWQDFRGSGAFDELLFELCTNAEKSAEFINGIFPGNLEQLAAEIAAEVAAKKPAAKAKAKAGAKKAAQQAQLDDPDGYPRKQEITNATPESPIVLSQAEMVDMEPEDLQTGLAAGRFKLVA